MIPTEEAVSSVLAARLFGMTRSAFYAFAKRHNIPDLGGYNAAKQRQEHSYPLGEVMRVYVQVYQKELTRADVERLRNESA